MMKVSNADGAGAIRYEHLTEAEYAAGLLNVTSQALAADYGDRTGVKRNAWGRYVMLMPENRTPVKVSSFETAIGWVDPDA